MEILNNLVITFYMSKTITRIPNPGFRRYHIVYKIFFFNLSESSFYKSKCGHTEMNGAGCIVVKYGLWGQTV